MNPALGYSLLILNAVIAGVLCQTLGEPGFLEEPDDSRVVGGSSVFLRCRVENAVGAVQWTRDGFGLGTDRTLPGYPRYNIHGAPALGEYDLFISNARLEDDAVFQCQIGPTQTTPGRVSREAVLTVLLPPDTPYIDNAVTPGGGSLQHLEVTEGVAYPVTCHADNGKPAPTVEWLINGVAVTDNMMYEVVTAAGVKTQNAVGKYTLWPTKADQNKQVECRVRNEALQGHRLTRVYLKVLYAPEIQFSADPSRKVREGGAVRVQCEAEANPNEITYKWFEGDTAIDGATESTFVLRGISRDQHTHVIRCEATNSVGTTAYSHTLNVEYAPYFTAEPVPVPAEPGDDVTLTCSVAGNPEPALEWTRQGSLRVLSRADTLHLPDIGVREIGVYRCTASSVDFPAAYRDFHILKKGPPRITSSRTQSARLGETASLECQAISVPEPDSIVWARNGEAVNTENKRFTVREVEVPHGRKSILQIQSAQNKDFGGYNCTVTNSYGPVTALIQFNKEEVVSLTYILLGVLLSVAFIIVALVIVYVLYRRRKTDSEYGSDSSENTLQKKDDKPEVSHVTTGQDGGPVDAWANSTVHNLYEHKPYAVPNNYDDMYTNKQPYGGYDYGDGYGNYGYNAQPGNPYGTFPRPLHQPHPRYAASDYGGPALPSHYSDVGTYGRSRTPQPAYHIRPPYQPGARPHYAASDYGASLPRPAPAKLDSRLATNV